MIKDPEKRRATQRAYHVANRERRNAATARWARENKEHRQRKELVRRTEKRAQCLVAHARIRARRAGLPFALNSCVRDLQQRIDTGVCELTGFPLSLSGGERQFASPSLDRIIPALGYVPDNVRVICYGMNAALGNWGEDALRQMIAAWFAKPSSSPT